MGIAIVSAPNPTGPSWAAAEPCWPRHLPFATEPPAVGAAETPLGAGSTPVPLHDPPPPVVA